MRFIFWYKFEEAQFIDKCCLFEVEVKLLSTITDVLASVQTFSVEANISVLLLLSYYIIHYITFKHQQTFNSKTSSQNNVHPLLTTLQTNDMI